MTLETFLNELVPNGELVEVVNMTGIGAARLLCAAKDMWTAGFILLDFYCAMYEVKMVSSATYDGVPHLTVYVTQIEDEED